MSVGEKAWIKFKEIERVLEERYQLSEKRVELSDLSSALQRLGQAILLRYNLSSQEHPMEKKWTINVKVSSALDLQTTKQMLKANIIEWEDALPSEKVGPDVWSGRSEGWRAQRSLESVLNEDYFEIKKIVGITSQQAEDMLMRIESVVKIELDRLVNEDDSEEKMNKINEACTLLRQAVYYKYKIKDKSITLSEKIKTKIDAMDIYSYTTMLDAEIKGRSLRQALNLSSKSWLRPLMGLQEALWGQTTALENVEKALFPKN